MSQSLSIPANQGAGAARNIPLAAWGTIVAGAVGATIGIGTTLYPRLAQPGSSVFVVNGVVLTAHHLVMLAAVAVLAGAGISGRGVFPRVAYAVALAGLALQAAAEALLRVDFNAGVGLFNVVMPLLGVGMILVGITVIRAHVWTGISRFAPLLCGAYVFVVLFPSFALAKGPSFIALAGFSLCYMLLGVAMRGQAQAR
jgi:hypothetical protein